jgi:hypothetical protein
MPMPTTNAPLSARAFSNRTGVSSGKVNASAVSS